MSKKQILGVMAMVFTVAGGAVAGAASGAPGISAAQEASDSASAAPSDSPDAGDTTSPTEDGSAAPDSSPATPPADSEAEGSGGDCGGEHRGPGGPGGERRGLGVRAELSAAATALGLGEDELRVELRAGKSLADVAEEKGIDVQVVVDALVAATTAEIDARVAAGDFDSAKADELKADLADRIAKMVDHAGGFAGGPKGDRPVPGKSSAPG